MKLLRSVRTIAGNRLTKIDPGPVAPVVTQTHDHSNPEALEKIQVVDDKIKIQGKPLVTHLLREEW